MSATRDTGFDQRRHLYHWDVELAEIMKLAHDAEVSNAPGRYADACVVLAAEVRRLRTALAEAKRYDPLNAPMALRDMAVILDDAASKPADWATVAILRAAAANARGISNQLDRVMPLLAKEGKR